MPIQLTTPVDPGDLDTAVLDHVKIMRQVHDSRRLQIRLDLEFGTIIDDKWVQGGTAPAVSSNLPTNVIISEEEYTAIVDDSEPIVLDADPADPVRYGEVVLGIGTVWREKTYYAVKRGLYEWLQTQYASLTGTIV